MATTTADIMRFTEGERQAIAHMAKDYIAFTVNGMIRHSDSEGDITITGTYKRTRGSFTTPFSRKLLEPSLSAPPC